LAVFYLEARVGGEDVGCLQAHEIIAGPATVQVGGETMGVTEAGAF